MAQDSQPTLFLSWQFLVMLAAALGVFIVQPSTFPIAPGSDLEKAGQASGYAGQPVRTDSRLWADPFEKFPPNVDSAQTSLSSAKNTVPMAVGLPELSTNGLKAIAAGKICVMPVIVRGDANSNEAFEMRVRFRIATASGLGADGYTPDDPYHLTWVRMCSAEGSPEPMPVEWFIPGGLNRNRPPSYSAILVVWVRDYILNVNPLIQLEGIREQLNDQLSKLGLFEAQPPEFKVIGPYWSGTLVDILNEKADIGRGMTLYSSSATMADGVLDLLTKDKESPISIGRKKLTNRETGPFLVNLTCTDEELSEAMIRELSRRGIDPSDKDTRIAIISDWDTEYGRVLPLTFAAKYSQLVNPGAPRGSLPAEAYNKLMYDEADKWPIQIIRAYYLSGVEGNLKASDETSQKPADESKTAPGSNTSAVSLQRAEGEHQVDYVARLGRILSTRITDRNKDTCDNGRLKAIGVLGADVYDKLLLVQALRPIFKDAIFFTDMLDARFMDPVKAIPFTRNLVISTSFGFELFRNFQVGVSPFRSTEQTGAFLAVQTAAAQEGNSLDLKNITDQLKPQGFEIGRTYPVALKMPGTTSRGDEKNDLCSYVDKFTGPLQPPLSDFFPIWPRFRALYLLPALLGIASCILLYITVKFVDGGHLPAAPWEKPRFWVIGFSVTGFLAVIGILCRFYDGIEPATWIQGVSLWPSECVRILAFAVSFIGVLYCYSRVRKSRQRLADEFGVTRPEKIPQENPADKLLTRWWKSVRRPRQPEAEYVMTYAKAQKSFKWVEGTHGREEEETRTHEDEPHEGETEPEKFVILEELWRNACIRSASSARTARTLTMTVLYFLGWLLLAMACGGIPMPPYRGAFSLWCDQISVIGASLMLIYLMFWVVDETHLCLRFIKKLGRQELTIWPKVAYRAIPALMPRTWKDNIYESAASSYLDVCFIGKLSREAIPTIILPFAALTLMIIARWSYFANWHWSALIFSAFGIDSAVCVFCAVKLRLHAVDAKERAICQIERAAAESRAANAGNRADALEALKSLMQQNMEGAYVPWHQQPFVSALLIPFGGSGGLGLVEYFLSKQ